MDNEEPTQEDLDRFDKREATHQKRLEVLGTLEKRIGIPVGYLWSLNNERDGWAFIVKIAVICEAALTHALVIHFKNPELLSHFSDVANNRRLELAKETGLISKEDRMTLGAIAYVRNQFAHKPENLGSSLHKFFDSRTPDKKAELLNDLIQLEGKGKAKATDNFARQAQFFRLQLFMCALRPLQSIAAIGLDADAKAAEQKRWTLADMWPKEPLTPEELANYRALILEDVEFTTHTLSGQFAPSKED
jgi:hypothetical protein